MENAAAGEWCTVESDPGVFTEMLEQMGCKTVELEELYSLDDDSLAALKRSTGAVHGLIFLFQWTNNKKKPDSVTGDRKPLAEADIPDGLFFAHQVTTNACATQAILSVVLNADAGDISQEELGPTLAEFRSFTASFPPALKGVAISSSDEIRQAHNAFARQDAFLQEGKFHIPTDKDEAFHFVAYIPVDGVVYELDGLQKGPIVIGKYRREGEMEASSDNDGDAPPAEDWLTVARAAMQERMSAGAVGGGEGGGEAEECIKFNLMAVIQDKRVQLKKALETLDENQEDYSQLTAQLAAEQAKRDAWRLENQRRRHNYVPLCMQLIKELARTGNLPQLVSEAKERYAAKRQKMLASGKS